MSTAWLIVRFVSMPQLALSVLPAIFSTRVLELVRIKVLFNLVWLAICQDLPPMLPRLWRRLMWQPVQGLSLSVP